MSTNRPATPPPPPKVPSPNTSSKSSASTKPGASAASEYQSIISVTKEQLAAFKLFEFIQKLLQAGTPTALIIQPLDLKCLLDQIHEKFMKKRSALVECRAPINICGDTHGQYNDVLRIFNACGAPTKVKYLFLGDYVDRGRHSLEVICLLFALKLARPGNVNLLRGNHELKAINKNYGFYAELKTRLREHGTDMAEAIYNKFNAIFSWMPLAAVVSKRILCMHGGISPKLTSLDDIRNIPLPLETAKSHPLACDLLWADPDPNVDEFAFNSTRAISHIFGEKQVRDLCQKLDIDLVIRAHQVVELGFAFFASRKLITVFSASRYQDDVHNYAGVVRVSRELDVCFLQLKPEELEKRYEEAGPEAKEREKEQPTGANPPQSPISPK